MAKKIIKPAYTTEEVINKNNQELIKALASALNTAILTREAINHSVIVMNETSEICKLENGLRVNRKRYSYLSNKVADLDRVIVPLITTLEKTLGVSGMKRNLDEATGIYSDLFDCVELEETK